MSSLLDLLPQLPISQGMTKLIDWITVHFSSLFDALENVGTKVMEFMTSSLLLIPPLIFILLVVILAYFVSDKRYGLPFFCWDWFIIYSKPKPLGKYDEYFNLNYCS